MAVFVSAATAESPPSQKTVTPPGWEEAFARRDFRLGISLTEFKAMPNPDDPESFSVCSNEPQSEDREFFEAKIYSEAFIQAGMVKCIFFEVMDFGLPTKTPTPSGLLLGDLPLLTEFYFISPDGDDKKYLFWISTRGPSEAFDSLLPAFEKAYGLPATDATEDWQSQSGSVFKNRVLIWRNAVSSIEFRRLGNRLTSFELDHQLTPLMHVLDQRLDAKAAQDAGKL